MNMHHIRRQSGIIKAIQNIVSPTVDVHENLHSIRVLYEYIPDVLSFDLGEGFMAGVNLTARVARNTEGIPVDVKIPVGVDTDTSSVKYCIGSFVD